MKNAASGSDSLISFTDASHVKEILHVKILIIKMQPLENATPEKKNILKINVPEMTPMKMLRMRNAAEKNATEMLSVQNSTY